MNTKKLTFIQCRKARRQRTKEMNSTKPNTWNMILNKLIYSLHISYIYILNSISFSNGVSTSTYKITLKCVFVHPVHPIGNGVELIMK